MEGNIICLENIAMFANWTREPLFTSAAKSQEMWAHFSPLLSQDQITSPRSMLQQSSVLLPLM